MVRAALIVALLGCNVEVRTVCRVNMAIEGYQQATFLGPASLALLHLVPIDGQFCEPSWIKPALFCKGKLELVFDGCEWSCGWARQ